MLKLPLLILYIASYNTKRSYYHVDAFIANKIWIFPYFFYRRIPKMFLIQGTLYAGPFLIFYKNFISLLPYSIAITAHFSLTLVLRFTVWIWVKGWGLYTNPLKKIRHLLPQGTPLLLIPFMIIIETIRLIIQPITLGLRCAANITAGHLLIYLCSCAIWKVVINWPLLSPLVMISLIILLILEVAVAAIQAYVFLLLSISMAKENFVPIHE